MGIFYKKIKTKMNILQSKLKKFDEIVFYKYGLIKPFGQEKRIREIKQFLTNFYHEIREVEREKLIKEIKILKSANREDNMLTLEARMDKNEAYDEVIKTIKK